MEIQTETFRVIEITATQILLQLNYGIFPGWLLCSSPSSLCLKKALALTWTHLPHVIEAVFVEDRVNLGILKSTEQQRLAVVLGPVMEVWHSHSGKVYPMGIQRQQVNVLHQVLHTHRNILLQIEVIAPRLQRALTTARKWTRKSKIAQNIKAAIAQDTAAWDLLTPSRVIHLISFHRTQNCHLLSHQ